MKISETLVGGWWIFEKVEISVQEPVPEHSEVILDMAWKNTPEVSKKIFRDHVGDWICEKVEISGQQPVPEHSVVILGMA